MNKKLLIFFFIYIVLEGALRKWFLPEYNNLLFLLKDIILIVAFLFLVLDRKSAKKSFSYIPQTDKTIWLIFVVFIFYHGLVINFGNLTIIGWRYYLVSIPLIVLIPPLFYNNLAKYSYFFIIIAIPILLLGLYQYFSPYNAEINKYAWSTSESFVAVFGDNKARITSTFSYITPYSVFLQTIFLLTWIPILKPYSKRSVYISFATLFLIIINLFMTGSRAPILLSAILVLPFLYYYLKRSRNKLKIVGFIIILIIFSFNLIIDPFNAFTTRTEKAGDTDLRIYGALLTPYITLSTIDFKGTGLASTFLGTRELSNQDLKSAFDEVNQDRVGVEIGIIGYLLVLYIKIYFLIKTFFLMRRSRDYEIKLWLWFSLTLQLSSLWTIPIFNSIAATFYFTAIGIYYLMKHKHTVLLKQNTSFTN